MGLHHCASAFEPLPFVLVLTPSRLDRSMPVRTRLNFLILTASVIGLLLIPATAFAYAPTGDDFITCVAGGDSNVECVAGVFEANTDCTFEATPGGTGSGTSDADGEFAFDFDVPTDDETDVELSIQCGTKVLADTVANVNAEGEVIANAGSNAGVLALGAVGAIALGGGALAISRRKRTSDAV